MVNVWVLADDRAGNVSQVIGVAEALGYVFEIKNINYNLLAGLPNFLLGSSLVGLDSSSRRKISPPYPDIVIAAGRKTAPVARFIKKQNNGKTFLVQLMYPGDFGALDFDLIAVPNHDNKAPDLPNIIRITGAAHKITKDKLLNAKEKWSSIFSELPSPKIALIVGGATKNKKFTSNLGEELAALANKFAANFNNCSFLISTSRRTPQNTSEKIIENIKYPKFVYKWGDREDNPYLGFLACADYIIVTGDSVSMCSEACATGSSVFIYAPKSLVSAKHQRLVNELWDNNYAFNLTNPNINIKINTFNSAEQIALKIKEKYFVDN